ncbi:MAG: helix-turn-helix domain-containing protein [Planctomycetota bacterium]|jgi:transcriptional regulator with XRE-family HTH domain
MSVIDHGDPAPGVSCGETVQAPPADRPLHRLATVRECQGISLRALARRLNVDVSHVKSQEDENADMLLSTLYQWQEALDVPIAELLVDSSDPVSAPVTKRAQLVRLMKTAAAILDRSQQLPIRRMAQMLVEQLLEIMPELESVTPWHAVGKRRSQDEIGQSALRGLAIDWFRDYGE